MTRAAAIAIRVRSIASFFHLHRFTDRFASRNAIYGLYFSLYGFEFGGPTANYFCHGRRWRREAAFFTVGMEHGVVVR